MSSFSIGKPASPNKLVDRKTETNYLITKMNSKKINYNVAVLGYRRIGKTSILLKVANTLAKKSDTVVIYFDIKKNMSEPKLFLTRLQKEIFNTYIEKLSISEKIRAKKDIAGAIFSNIRNSLSLKKISAVGAELSTMGIITPKIEIKDKNVDYSTLFYSVFNTATAFAEKNNLKFVIILDEFQDLRDLENYQGLKNIFSLFRSVIQDRGDNVSFMISGSRVHLLDTILGSGESPLFVHFERQDIGELDEKNAILLFKKYLQARKVRQVGGGGDADNNNKIAKQAYELVGGHPLYLMALAESWDQNVPLNDTFDKLLTSPLGTLRLYCQYLLSEDLSTIIKGPMPMTILRAISEHVDGLSISEIAKKIDSHMSKLPRYIKPLIDADLLLKKDGRCFIRDKILRQYLKNEARELF